MNTKEAIESMEIAVQFARLLPDASAFRIANNVAKLNRLGREAHTHAENVCNYPMPEGADEKKRESIKRRAIDAIAEIGLVGAYARNGTISIEVHGDPRGSCLQIEVKATKAHKLAGATIRFRF